jgi:hypothetical protein
MINQILELGVDDEFTQATITLNKVLDEIMLAPQGPKRWRAVVDVLHKTNPIAGEDDQGRPLHFREVNRDCILENKLARETAFDKFGRSEDNSSNHRVGSGSNFRDFLSMPRIVKTMIEQCDFDAFRGQKNSRKMFDCFPEYRRSESW